MEDTATLHDYLGLFSIAILYYDHLITFPEELRYIWKWPFSMASVWFFLNRYIPFSGNVVVLIIRFNVIENESCGINAFARQLLLIVSQLVICTISAIRTHAIYGRSGRILALILTIGLGGMSVVCWSLVDEHRRAVRHGGECHVAMTHTTAVRLAAAWEAGLVFDLFIFALTVFKSYQAREVREWSKTMRLGGMGLMEMLLRDGALYFGIISLATLANVLTFYLAPIALRGALSTFSSCISTTMMSRLMLHIHAMIASPSLGDTTSHDDVEPMEFNTPRMAEHNANARQSIPEASSHDAAQHYVSEARRSVHETI